MIRRSIAAVIALTLTQAAAQSSAVEPLGVDDFTAGPGFSVIIEAQGEAEITRYFDDDLPPANTVGGSRLVEVQSNDGPLRINHDAVAGAFLASDETAAGLTGDLDFVYGLDPSGTITPLDLDLTDYNALAASLLFNQSNDVVLDNMQAQLQLFMGRPNSPSTLIRPYVVTGTASIPATPSPQLVLLPFAQLSVAQTLPCLTCPPPDGRVDLLDIDVIEIEIDSSGANSSLGIDGFSFVYLPALDGDFNADGVVDATDHEVYAASFGAAVEPGNGADGNGNGVIDAGDYTVWRDAMGSAASQSVPEPAAMSLLLVASAASSLRRRR